MEFVIAIAPILGIFILLFIFKQSSLRAGLFAYGVAVLITILTSSFALELQGVFHASIKGALIAFIAAYVLFFGIFLFHLMNKAGAIDNIARFISRSTDDKILQLLLLVVGFSPLIESTSGFGTAFLVVAPILIALGFSGMKAALIGLVSLLAVPWGALATGTIIGAESGNIPLQDLGLGSAIISIPVFVYFVIIAVYIAGGRRALRNKWKEVSLFLLTFSTSILLFNAYVSVELAGVLASLITIGIGLAVINIKAKNNEAIDDAPKPINILKAVSPYLLLTVFIMISRLVPPLEQFLNAHFVVELPEYEFSLALIYSPGFWLFVSCILTIMIFKINRKAIQHAFKATLKQWIPFAITTSAFVAMSEIMAAAGMTTLIATIAASLLGTGFVFISPLIGALGGFLTGSNTGANAMFINLQVQTAQQLSMPPELLAYAQNTGASHATMASPSRVMLGASLCNIGSQEGNLLKNMLFIVLGALLMIMMMVAGWWWML
ncbi:L-lactate permease [Salicibibacter kimchii]|uniref:L-lactate permease n=1 Tax=Salicibibacter kimchii TaxID=2099786 RepID=A0A345BYL2_9BACI|nr:L-lactate permease [Salicibibacter kimchii]AXF56043.1 L-lactate permease [Salicibibacter kimchii]